MKVVCRLYGKCIQPIISIVYIRKDISIILKSDKYKIYLFLKYKKVRCSNIVVFMQNARTPRC